VYHDFNYEATLASSLRAQWQLDDVLRDDQELDFSRNMMPESLARTAVLDGLNPFEQRILNQISAHQYLSIFGVVEEFILSFLVDHARPQLLGDDWRVRAILNFASEEAKHIHLFKRFHHAFVRGFPVECRVIGPSADIGAEILRHDPLAVGLVITRWILGKALLPVSRMTENASKWSDSDIDRRFDLGEPYDELTRLGATLDALLDRLASSLRHEQRLTAELSHELRTPLARIAAEAELALNRPREPEDYLASIEKTSEETNPVRSVSS
jgi:signal transduction histidine kinase